MSDTPTIPVAVLPLEYSPTDHEQVVTKIVWRLIPLLCMLYVVNYLDRTNVAMAKLRMLDDTGLDEAAYGFGAGLFFLGYFLFEVPSNLIMQRVGARIWMTRIMVTWGIISAAMMFVRGGWSFNALRFLLGLAEAGFFPGIVLYLTYWVPSRRRASVMATFLTSTAISGIIGTPLAGLLMKMEGIAGLHGWQWLFLIEGVIPVLLGFITIVILPDGPEHATWLSQTERDTLSQELSREHTEHHHHIAELTHALRDYRLWLFSTLYFMLVMGLYGFVFWVPSFVKEVKNEIKLSDFMIGVLSAIPYLIAAISMVIIGWHADRHNERRWHIAVSAMVAAAGFALVSQTHNVVSTIGALCIAAIGIWGSLGPFWALTTRLLRGTAAAGGIAIINSIGALAGIVAPWAIGWSKTHTGSFTGGLLLVAFSLVCGAGLVLCVSPKIDRG